MQEFIRYSTIRRITSRLTNVIYLSATAYWILRKLTGIQLHKVVAIDTTLTPLSISLEAPLEIAVLKRIQDIDHLPSGMETQLDEQSGMSCRALCEHGAHLYFIHDGKNIACQLNILTGDIVVDSPTHLQFRFQERQAFLNYLFTRDSYRGHGLARQLIQYACNDLAKRGTQRCFAHIRATNHASLSTFRHSGWKQCGKIITTISGRFLAAPGCAQSGIDVAPVKRA